MSFFQGVRPKNCAISRGLFQDFTKELAEEKGLFSTSKSTPRRPPKASLGPRPLRTLNIA